MPRAASTFIRRPRWNGLRQKIHPEDHDRFHAMMKFTPFDLQKDVIYDNHRFKVLSIGRRWGKSTLEAADNVVTASLGGWVWCVAPSYDLADIIFDECLNLCVDESLPIYDLVHKYSIAKGGKYIQFKTGGLIVPKTSDQPKSLVGRGIDKVVFDEAAKEQDPLVFQKYIMPCLSDRNGSCDMISTPEGHNWFYDEYMKGVGAFKNPAYRSWQFASITSPYFSKREWNYQKRNTPQNIFQQEYEAQFLADGGLVFRDINAAIYSLDGSPRTVLIDNPVEGKQYVMGVDLGRLSDWTVVTIMEASTRKVVYIERFNQLDWAAYQRPRIFHLANKWMAPVMIDATGLGDVFLSELSRMDMPFGVVPYVLTNDSKAMIVNSLALAFQNHEVAIPDEELLKHELQIFKASRLPSGRLSYSAPTGYHDDMVISLCFAYEMCLRYGMPHIGDAIVGEDIRLDRRAEWG